MTLPTIAALWMYGPLSFLEQLCLKSFVDAGHRVVLYHYGPLQNVPEGLELADANDILPQTNFLKHERTGSPALHSDLFRYKMLAKSRDTIWADTDAYCVKPFQTPNGHFYGWESEKHVNGGVLGLPADSDTLRALLDYTADEFAIPSWYGPEYEAELAAKRDAGAPVHASEQPWGVWGPHALTHFLHQTGEVKYALPREGLYPISFKDRRKMLRRNFDTTGYITDNTFSIHLYGRRMRARLVEKEGGAPHPRSLLGKLLIKHGIDPALAPLPPRKPAESEVAAPAALPRAEDTPPAALVRADSATAAPLPRADFAPAALPPRAEATRPAPPDPRPEPLAPPRAAMAPAPSEAPASAMAFVPPPVASAPRGTPLRARAGQLRPDPDAPALAPTAPAGDRTLNLPLYRLLLGRQGDIPTQVIVLTQPDTMVNFGSALRTVAPAASVRAITSDLSTAQALADTAMDMGEPDVIIDDTSDNPRQKQLNFMAFFATLKPGGLYLIECLHDDPNALETLAVFRSYVDSGAFVHPDPLFGRDFAVLQPEIDGCFIIPGGNKKDQTVVLHRR